MLYYSVPKSYQALMICTSVAAILIGLLRCAWSFFEDRRALRQSPTS